MSALDPVILQTLADTAVYNATNPASTQETPTSFEWNGRTVGLAVGTGVLVISCVALGVLVNPAFFAAIPIILGGAWALMGSPSINDLLGGSPTATPEQRPLLENSQGFYSPRGLSDETPLLPPGGSSSYDTNSSPPRKVTDLTGTPQGNTSSSSLFQSLRSPSPSNSDITRQSPQRDFSVEAKALKQEIKKGNNLDTLKVCLQTRLCEEDSADQFFGCALELYKKQNLPAPKDSSPLAKLEIIERNIQFADDMIQHAPQNSEIHQHFAQLKAGLQREKIEVISYLTANINSSATTLINGFQISPRLVQEFETSIKELENAVTGKPIDASSTTDFDSLSSAVTEQLRVATNNLNKIQREISFSERAEEGWLNRTKESIDRVKDRIAFLNEAANYHAEERVSQEAFEDLCHASSQANGNSKLELEIKREIYDSKLLIQRFIKANETTLQKIESLVNLDSPSEEQLANLHSEISNYTRALDELRAELETKSRSLASHKVKLSLIEASLLAEKNKLSDPRKISEVDSKLKEIKRQKVGIDHSIDSFVSIRDTELVNLEELVNSIGKRYNNWVNTRKETSDLRVGSKTQKDAKAQAETNHSRLKSINEKITFQEQYIRRWIDTPQFGNFLQSFADYARATNLPKDQWAQQILEILGQKFPFLNQLPQLQKPIIEALQLRGIVLVQTPLASSISADLITTQLNLPPPPSSSSNLSISFFSAMMSSSSTRPTFDDQVAWSHSQLDQIKRELEDVIPTKTPSSNTSKYAKCDKDDLDDCKEFLEKKLTELDQINLEGDPSLTDQVKETMETVRAELSTVNFLLENWGRSSLGH